MHVAGVRQEQSLCAELGAEDMAAAAGAACWQHTLCLAPAAGVLVAADRDREQQKAASLVKQQCIPKCAV